MSSKPFTFLCCLSEATFSGLSLSLSEQVGIINVVAFSWILTSLSPGLPHSLIGAIGLGWRPDREAENEGNEWACSFTLGWVWLWLPACKFESGWDAAKVSPQRCRKLPAWEKKTLRDFDQTLAPNDVTSGRWQHLYLRQLYYLSYHGRYHHRSYHSMICHLSNSHVQSQHALKM